MDCIKRKFIPVFILYVTLLVMTNTLFNLFPTVLVYLLTAYSDQFNLFFILVIILFYLICRLISDFATKKAEMFYQVLSESNKTKIVSKMLSHTYSKLQSSEIRTKLSNTLFAIDNQSLFIRYYEIIITLVYTSVTLLFSAAIISKINPFVALTCVVIVGLSIGINELKKKILLMRTNKLLNINNGLNYFEQLAKNELFLSDNKVYDLSILVNSRFHKYTAKTNKTLRKGMFRVAFFDGVSSFLGVASLVIGSIMLITLSKNQAFSELSLAITALFTFVGMIENSFAAYLQLLTVCTQLSSYYSLDKLKCVTSNFDDTSEYAIEMNNISYAYTGSNKVIDNLTMKIKKGETVALVGENGSGKTTLIGIIAGILEPQTGSVSNGVNHNYAFVQQESIQFPETIIDNIIIDKEKERSKIESVIQSVNLESILLQDENFLGKKLNPTVNADGISLSGGQFQRLIIARGLYQDSQLLILDEPTASLDIENEHTIFETVSKLHDIETKVFISHRLANCQIADTIYFLKGGKIIETGSHDELMTKKGAYYELFSKQSKIYVGNDINILETHIT